jgi:hypothetical protein
MRRSASLLSLLLLVAACGQQPESGDDSFGNTSVTEEGQATTTYSGPGRNQLCLKEPRAGFIVYASRGDANCSVRGRFERNGNRLIIKPDGDLECSIEAREDASSIALGPVAPACDYYCGPNASFAGAIFDMVPASRPVTDFAGDPLC